MKRRLWLTTQPAPLPPPSGFPVEVCHLVFGFPWRNSTLDQIPRLPVLTVWCDFTGVIGICLSNPAHPFFLPFASMNNLNSCTNTADARARITRNKRHAPGDPMLLGQAQLYCRTLGRCVCSQLRITTAEYTLHSPHHLSSARYPCIPCRIPEDM